jgi:hypothetical protein
MGKSSKVSRAAVRNSTAQLSDSDPISSGHESDNTPSPPPKTKTPKSRGKPATKPKSKNAPGQRVSEEKHHHAKGFKNQSMESMSAIEALVRVKTESERMKQETLAARLKAEENNRKFEVAKMILGMDTTSDEAKAKANATLIGLLI